MRWTTATLDGRAFFELYGRKELSLLYDNTRMKIGEKILVRGVKDVYNNELIAWAHTRWHERTPPGWCFYLDLQPQKTATTLGPASLLNRYRILLYLQVFIIT